MPTAHESTATDGTRTGLVAVHDRMTGSNGRLLSFLPTARRNWTLPVALCLMALLAVAVNVNLIFEVGRNHGSEIKAGSVESGLSDRSGPTSEPAGLHSVRNRLILLLAVIVISFGSILYLFAKRFVIPLNQITTVVRQMADGDLSASLPDRLPEDMKDLGQAVLDFGANSQEVLLFTGTTVGNLSSAIDRIEAGLECNPVPTDQMMEDLQDVKADLEMLASVVHDFEFFRTRFNGRNVISEISRSDQWDVGDKQGRDSSQGQG